MPADLNAIMKLEVPVIVRIAERTMPLGEVKNLAPGAIIELPKTADEELEILINNKPIGAGVAVKVGENFGLRVTFVGDVKQRIAALGQAPGASSEEETNAIANNGPRPEEAAEVEEALAAAEAE